MLSLGDIDIDGKSLYSLSLVIVIPKKTSKYLEMELKHFLGVEEESSRAKNGGNKGKNSETNHQRETSYY